MKKCMQKVAKKEGLQRLRRRQAFTTLFQFIPVLDRWANLLVFPVKPSVYLFSIRKPRACQKLGNGPGVGKCPAPGQCKICKCPTPGTDKAGKCPAVARGGGVAGRMWNWLMHNDNATWDKCVNERLPKKIFPNYILLIFASNKKNWNKSYLHENSLKSNYIRKVLTTSLVLPLPQSPVKIWSMLTLFSCLPKVDHVTN